MKIITKPAFLSVFLLSTLSNTYANGNYSFKKDENLKAFLNGKEKLVTANPSKELNSNYVTYNSESGLFNKYLQTLELDLKAGTLKVVNLLDTKGKLAFESEGRPYDDVRENIGERYFNMMVNNEAIETTVFSQCKLVTVGYTGHDWGGRFVSALQDYSDYVICRKTTSKIHSRITGKEIRMVGLSDVNRFGTKVFGIAVYNRLKTVRLENQGLYRDLTLERMKGKKIEISHLEELGSQYELATEFAEAKCDRSPGNQREELDEEWGGCETMVAANKKLVQELDIVLKAIGGLKTSRNPNTGRLEVDALNVNPDFSMFYELPVK